MRFWRSDKDEQAEAGNGIKSGAERLAERAAMLGRSAKAFTANVRARNRDDDAVSSTIAMRESNDVDLRMVWDALRRKKHWIIGPTLLALVISLAVVNMITPRYKSEARILIDGRENVFLRPNGERADERSALDPEAVASQVQLLLSRDLARKVITQNKLAESSEFDSVLQGLSPVKALLALVGFGRDPFRMTPEERVLDSYNERLTAYAVDKSRVIVVEFQSRDPDLAARVANSIASNYLTMQQSARQGQAKSASQWLAGEIDALRLKVAEAEQRVEDFRSKSSLFIGTNNTSLSNQQLGEINSQLAAARSQKAEAESRARLIKEMLTSGKPIEASEIANSELMRRLSEQRVTLLAQLAEQSATLLDRHPRIRELRAQLSDLDRQIRDEAGKISRSLENDARIASGRVEGLSASLDQSKKAASSTNGQDVQLRALDREAKAQRDLLESYLAKYREANARENIDGTPTDGRIISQAIVSNTPTYPKKLPIVLIATLATLLLTSGFVATSELMRVSAPLGEANFFNFARNAREVVAAEPTGPAQGIMAGQAAAREIDAVARKLTTSTPPARKITILGTGREDAISMTALTLARSMASGARVVLVDLSLGNGSVAAASAEPTAPGLTELMKGDATFAQIITRDKVSTLHLVNGGRGTPDRAAMLSPRLSMTIDALLRVYDHVLLDAGAATDLPTSVTSTGGRAVVVPDVATGADARKRQADKLVQAGFAEVIMLDAPSDGSPRHAAA